MRSSFALDLLKQLSDWSYHMKSQQAGCTAQPSSSMNRIEPTDSKQNLTYSGDKDHESLSDRTHG